MVNSGIHIVEEVQVFRDLQPVESLVISHIQVRDRTSRGTPHMGHADVMKLPLCCLGCWGDMAPRSPQLRICAGAQEGSLGKQTNLPISTDWELGALLVHTYEGRAVLWGQGEDQWAPWGTPQPSRTMPDPY